MKKTRIVILIFPLIAVLVLLSGCFTKKENKIVLGIHSWPGGGTAYVAQEKGFFKEEGITIDIKKIENFDTKRSSLIGGSIDIDVANTLDQLLIYRENGFDAQVIGITDESTGGDGLVVKSDIDSISQLKGKTIAYAEASPSDFFLRYILSQNNITLDQIKLKPVADPQIAGNTIIAKQVDGAVTFEPWLTQASQTEGLKVLVSTKEYPVLIPGLLITNGHKVAADKETYTKFLKAWFKAVAYIKANPTESYGIIAKGMGMKEQDVKDILSKVTIQGLAENKKLLDKNDPDNLLLLIQKIFIFWKESKFISKEMDPNAAVNTDIVKGL